MLNSLLLFVTFFLCLTKEHLSSASSLYNYVLLGTLGGEQDLTLN